MWRAGSLEEDSEEKAPDLQVIGPAAHDEKEKGMEMIPSVTDEQQANFLLDRIAASLNTSDTQEQKWRNENELHKYR